MRVIIENYTKYYSKKYPKRQVYLHHTVSPNSRSINKKGISGDVAHWLKQKYNLGTYCIIDADGTIYQLFGPSYWAYHLGTRDRSLNWYSVGIELDSLGPLIKVDDRFTSKAYPNKFYVEASNVTYYPLGYRGNYYYESYTTQQIASLKKELQMLNKRFEIPLFYDDSIWDLSKVALAGSPGIFSHTSVRSDKSDVHPQPELITMLKSLTNGPSLNPDESLVYTKEYLEKLEQLKSLRDDYIK